MACAIVFAIGILCYLPALHGPFILDDNPNFYGLRFVDNLSSALAYSLNGPAGTRWISYLSFTAPIEIEAWGDDNAFPFKLINLIIHGINSLLVFICLRQLLITKERHYPYPALWATAITLLWAIHPIHVNTVLYSVQRMTLLSSSFVLIGIYYHLIFTRHHQDATDAQWILYTGIIGLITITGILCKESGILLPLYILSCSAFLPEHTFRRWQTSLTLVTPYVLLLAYLVFQHRLNYGGRHFTMEERLLSQVVILKEYVIKIVLPSFSSFSLYYDDFQPVRTITDLRLVTSSLFWLALLTLAKLGNKHMPGLWFGCLWFLAGHVLESTIIPLELYFDHRNYLPSLGILVMAAAVLRYLFSLPLSKPIYVLLMILPIAITGKYLYQLQQETRYWHNDITLSESLISKHPESMRATQYYIENLASQGRYHDAITMIEYMHKKFGIAASNAIFQIGISCIGQPDVTINHQKLIADLQTLPADMAISNAMDFLLRTTNDKACPSLDWKIYEQYTDSLLSNRRQKRHFHNLVFLLIRSHMYQNDFETALKSSFKLQKSLRTPQFLFLQMHLSLSTKNLPTAELIYADIRQFDKPKKILYKEDIEKIGLALDKLRNERQN